MSCDCKRKAAKRTSCPNFVNIVLNARIGNQPHTSVVESDSGKGNRCGHICVFRVLASGVAGGAVKVNLRDFEIVEVES